MKTIAAAAILSALSVPCLADTTLGSREVLLDNAAVEVVRLTYPAGSESGMHSHDYPHRVAYVVRGGTLQSVPADPDQPTQIIELADGQAVYLPAATHNIRNVGQTEIVIIETELK